MGQARLPLALCTQRNTDDAADFASCYGLQVCSPSFVRTSSAGIDAGLSASRRRPATRRLGPYRDRTLTGKPNTACLDTPHVYMPNGDRFLCMAPNYSQRLSRCGISAVLLSWWCRMGCRKREAQPRSMLEGQSGSHPFGRIRPGLTRKRRATLASLWLVGFSVALGSEVVVWVRRVGAGPHAPPSPASPSTRAT